MASCMGDRISCGFIMDEKERISLCKIMYLKKKQNYPLQVEVILRCPILRWRSQRREMSERPSIQWKTFGQNMMNGN